MNERIRRWSCPCCSSFLPYSDLEVDGYFSAAIAGVSEDEVHVKADGSWSKPSIAPQSSSMKPLLSSSRNNVPPPNLKGSSRSVVVLDDDDDDDDGDAFLDLNNIHNNNNNNNDDDDEGEDTRSLDRLIATVLATTADHRTLDEANDPMARMTTTATTTPSTISPQLAPLFHQQPQHRNPFVRGESATAANGGGGGGGGSHNNSYNNSSSRGIPRTMPEVIVLSDSDD
jgi:hypothetical protein